MTTGLPTGYKQFSLVVPKPSSRVRKGKNLFDLAFSFKNFGVGARFTRSGWQYPEPCYWTVTSVKPRKNVSMPFCPPPPQSISEVLIFNFASPLPTRGYGLP
jgi:hypothetical protein